MPNIEIPNEKCVVYNLSIGYLDDSLCGVESLIKAKGLRCDHGEIKLFEICETDMHFADFMRMHPTLTYYAYAPVHIYNELNYLDVDVAACMFDRIKHLFPELVEITLPLESYCSDEYHAMRDAMQSKMDPQDFDELLSDYQCRNDR